MRVLAHMEIKILGNHTLTLKEAAENKEVKLLLLKVMLSLIVMLSLERKAKIEILS